MWEIDDIEAYFSLFGASPTVLDSVRKKNITQEDMDNFTVLSLINFGISSKGVCATMIRQWKASRSNNEDPIAALGIIQQAMESYNEVLAFKADRNDAICSNLKQDTVDTIKYNHLLRIIREQEARIVELENRESGFIDELDKRAQLIHDLEKEMTDLAKATQEKAMDADDIKKHLTQNHSLFHQKIDETKTNVSNIDQHVHSILQMAKRTVDIIQEEEERNRQDSQGDGSDDQDQDMKSRLIQIDQISIENLKTVSKLKSNMADGEASLDPFVVLKLTEDAIETKKLSNSGPNPKWEDLNIELQATDDECNEEYNKLEIEVWDTFGMNLSNELICSGEISFTHLDMLQNRGLVMSSVDLLNSAGKVVSTAKVNISVTKSFARSRRIVGGGAEKSYSSMSISMRVDYDVGDQVMCNYGGEGEWLSGRIVRFKKIRDRSDTRRLYEIEFPNGDLEVNVPISRLRDMRITTSATKTSSEAHSADDNTHVDGNSSEETSLEALFSQNNAELLAEITDVQKSSHHTIGAIMELDDWQKKLTQLLSDALRRYFEINAAAKKYSVYVNSLSEKVVNIDHFLQRIEISEQKSDSMNADCDKLRNDIEDLRRQLTEMTRQRDQERDDHTHTKHLLEQEKQVTLDCKKQIIDLRSELDHLIEVMRRDMSNRITSKNVNEELYSLSSKLVKTDVETTNVTQHVEVTHNTSATDHDDIFMQQHDWKQYLSLIKCDMTSQEVGEAHATLHNLQKSFEILSSRLILECRHRADCEVKLLGAKENLRDIKDDIITEATLRLQLEEEMQYFKETSEKYKEEVEKHKKFSVIAKKAAYDAIKQARYFQQKLNIEIDNIHENGTGFSESKVSLNQDQKQGGTPKKGRKSSNKVLDLDDYDGLFDDTDDDSGGGDRKGRRRKLTRSSTGPASRSTTPNSPYLHGRKKNRNHSYNNLQTRSENEKDCSASQASFSSKKSKKIKMPGKKQMSYVGKKITRALFDGKGGSRSSVGIAPDDTSTGGRTNGSAKTAHKAWVNPNHVNYAEKYGKEPPSAASRRAYNSQPQYD